MKTHKYTLIIFFFLHISCFAQDNKKDIIYYPNIVNYFLSYNNSYFYNVNGKPVNFPNLNIGLSLDPGKTISPSFGFSYYFPKNYNGELLLKALYDTLNPQQELISANMEGGGIAVEVNILLRFKRLSYMSKTEDFMLIPMIGITAYNHTITYIDNEVNYERLSYYISNNQGTSIGTLNFGLIVRYRFANIPMFIKISQNKIISNKTGYKSTLQKNFSSYLNIGFGLTFPINKGPGVSKIKTIKY
ncbi:MAG: hypothetical protein A2X08_03670 [Bacteroidetes bacterium GWA2_32_17]|nr:MAG: hypothetical protein A2X08_03670 [Bacteroidetes bacterium GWA2_32_17]